MAANTITLMPDQSYGISDHLYGIFLEDIGFSVDGGLNSNLINNYSFDGVYMNPETKEAFPDPLRYWRLDGGSMESRSTDGIPGGISKYARFTVNAGAVLSNWGYHGGQMGERPAMYISSGSSYSFTCFCRSAGFKGTMKICILDNAGQPLTDEAVFSEIGSGWKRSAVTLQGTAEGFGKLCVTFDGTGTLDLDCLEFRRDDYWKPGDSRYRHGKFRKDLVETLRDLHPSFMRFPGGCIVEGMTKGNEYNWKDTVGELWERKSNYSLWSEKMPDGGYNQSYQIGFYEYFCLCEDLNMAPLPTLYAGMNCQVREMQYKIQGMHEPADSPDFQTYVIQNYLDLIEFATGDPAKNKWAALRSDMGHPSPFPLEMIGVGNENYGDGYIERFEAISRAVHKQYPQIRLVACNGFLPFSFATRKIWKYIRSNHPQAIVDEHSYHSPRWFEKQARRYDKYPRNTATVYVGEYSANGLFAGKKMTVENSNCLDSALGEAAFMTGLERNGDVVEMSSYAPLFNLVDSKNWFSNLIDFTPKAVCPSVNYFTQLLFRKYYGPEYIPFTGKLSKGLYVSATGDDSHIYIKIVNTSSVTHRLQIEGCSAKPEDISSSCLSCSSLQEKNRITFYGDPDMKLVPVEADWQTEDRHLYIKAGAYSISALSLRR